VTDFLLTVRAEWTKLRTVRGWIAAMAAALLLTVGIGLLTAEGTQAAGGCPGRQVCGPPTGPGGEAVDDGFTFVHRPLGRDGTLTVRITALTGQVVPLGNGGPARPDLEPWAKAGLMVKAGTAQGATYAAVMVTGGHGVRLQSDFTHDTAGPQGPAPTAAAPRWLRLNRAGPTVTGATSSDGSHWTRVGSVRLPGLPATARIGLFTTSPAYSRVDRHAVGQSSTSQPARATAVFDHVTLASAPSAPAGGWRTTVLGGGPALPDSALPDPAVNGAGPGPGTPDAVDRSGPAEGRFTVRGSGDIAPAVGDEGFGAHRVEHALVGTFAGLLVLVVLGCSFVTAEYRRGMIRTTLAADPRRGRVLAAKALVVGGAAFAVGVVSAALCLVLTVGVLHARGVFVLPAAFGTQVRVVAGTGLLLALAAVLALAAGTVLRRGAWAVTAVTVTVVLPYLLAVSAAVPDASADWLLRLSPAAAFAVQQTVVRYPQVANLYAPADGYYPLPPWAGLSVLGGYTAVALAAAYVLLRGRDV
jgi:hypothetical protein